MDESDLVAEEDEGEISELRSRVQEARDLELEIAELEERLDSKKRQLSAMTREALPSRFLELGVQSLSIGERGNAPAFSADLKPYYKANIPEDRRPEAHRWLKENGHGDIIKTTFTIHFGLGDEKKAAKFEQSLLKAAIDYESKMMVPHTTLTAFVKQEFKDGRGKDLPLDVLGAQVGEIVKITVSKPK